jgi:hypothetical protein
MQTRFGGLFQPDVVLASQFFATQQRRGPQKRGEYRLLTAMLADAVDCVLNQRNRRLADEAWGWMVGEDGASPTPAKDRSPGFTFEYVCDVLEINPGYVRRGLQRWHAAQLAAQKAA